MAKPKQIERLKQGVERWNKWRTEHPNEHIDLSGANLSGANLSGANLSGANLSEIDLWYANVSEAALSRADLSRSNLLSTNFSGANFSRANLSQAFLINADLREADLTNADLRRADLTFSNLTQAHLDNADLRGCRVYGVSAWDVQLAGAKQTALVITPGGTAQITVDDLEVAQFIHLLLTNRKIRNVIHSVTSKAVLILGRFSERQKPVLDALHAALRDSYRLVPILFDWEPSKNGDLTETVLLLANMCRFVIADLTDAKSIPQELSLQLLDTLDTGVLARIKHWEEATDKAAAKERQMREEIEAQRAEIAKLNRQLAEGQGRR